MRNAAGASGPKTVSASRNFSAASRGDDAVQMLRTCLALAQVDGRVVAFLEPIALYMTKDLHEPNDGAWQFAYPPPERAIALGEGHVYDADAEDLTIITFGNGVYFSLRAARMLREDFLQQSAYHEIDRYCPIEKAYWMLKLIMEFHQLAQAAIQSDVSLDRITSMPVFTEIGRMKELQPEKAEKAIRALQDRVHYGFAELGV